MNKDGIRDGLSFLNDFVTRIWTSSENVKNVLESECNEARFVLRAWPIKTIITKYTSKHSCTCRLEEASKDDVREIVQGIGKALVQAQKLREKVAIDISKQKRKIGEPSLETIYLPKKAHQTISSKSQINHENTRVSGAAIDAQPKADKQSSIISKKVIGTAVPKQTNKIKSKAKNFIAVNKSNLKNLKPHSKSPSTFSPGGSSIAKESAVKELNSCASCITELNSLMTKVSLASTTKNTASCDNSKNLASADCSCHQSKENTQQRQQRLSKIKITSVDMIEGLGRFSILGDSALKVYHSYSSRELACDAETAEVLVEKKSQRATNRFLTAFDAMNDDRRCRFAHWKSSKDPQGLTDLTVDIARFFREIMQLHQSRPEACATIDPTIRYAQLDSRIKACRLNKFDPAQFGKRSETIARKVKNINDRSRSISCGIEGWSSNGVWNRVSLDSFPVAVTRSHCIRYAKKNQLLSLFRLNQRLQQLLYHRNLMELLIDNVIPNVIGTFAVDSAEYCEAYKMIFTIAQVLNAQLPVLVRTDI